jgi:hypothetical protein
MTTRQTCGMAKGVPTGQITQNPENSRGVDDENNAIPADATTNSFLKPVNLSPNQVEGRARARGLRMEESCPPGKK